MKNKKNERLVHTASPGVTDGNDEDEEKKIRFFFVLNTIEYETVNRSVPSMFCLNKVDKNLSWFHFISCCSMYWVQRRIVLNKTKQNNKNSPSNSTTWEQMMLSTIYEITKKKIEGDLLNSSAAHVIFDLEQNSLFQQ